MHEINFHPSQRDLRLFGSLLAVFLVIMAGLLTYRGYPSTVALSLCVAAAVSGLTAAVRPTALRYVYIGWMIAVFPIGWLVSHVVLALVYYGVFTPIGGLMRLCGKDPMQRRFDRQATSYWQRREPPRDATRYFRPF